MGMITIYFPGLWGECCLVLFRVSGYWGELKELKDEYVYYFQGAYSLEKVCNNHRW